MARVQVRKGVALPLSQGFAWRHLILILICRVRGRDSWAPARCRVDLPRDLLRMHLRFHFLG